MQMIDVMKRLAELDSANPNVIQEGTDKKKCPPMSHIKKMCQDGKSVAEICKMHPDCDQKELKQMVADCKKKLSEGAKPDFLDMDKDGDKKEPMKKAVADKKEVKERTEEDDEDDLTLESIRILTGIKKTIAECGIDTMSMLGETPQNTTPASINITAANGPELSGMLKDIMQLAGMQSAGGEEEQMSEPAIEIQPASGEMDATSTMRGMMDKLNQGGDDGMSADQGDVDNDGDHDMDDHNREKEKEMMDSYDNTPASPTDVPTFDANRYAHRENQPGQGDRMDGTAPKAYATFEEKLMDEYTKFINEAKKPSAGMTKKEKSAVVKKAKAGKDIGKKGPGFAKVAKKAAATYGSKEKGEKVAAAAMWKQQAKK